MQVMPDCLTRILEYYYNIQERSTNGTLTAYHKQTMVSELISAYNKLSYADRRDVLIPAKWEFLQDHALDAEVAASGKVIIEICYKWPPNDGFVGHPNAITLMQGEEYDRLGGSYGIYLTPIGEDGSPTSFLSRAIPYYIPEKDITTSPAYHRYRVVFHGQWRKLHMVWKGKIAHAFWRNPDDGGGIQVKLTRKIEFLERSILLEIK